MRNRKVKTGDIVGKSNDQRQEVQYISNKDLFVINAKVIRSSDSRIF